MNLLNKIISKINHLLLKFATRSQAAIIRSTPMNELSDRHLKNLKVLGNRVSFLEKIPKESIVAEIGVNQGEFSRQILEITKPKKLHLIDAWQSKRYHDDLFKNVKQKFERQINLGQLIINRGFSQNILKTFADHYFDWVYIDTAHTYEQTVVELELCLKKVKKGGLICGHDYTLWAYHGCMVYGVVQAVNEFCLKYDWEFLYLTHEPFRHLSFALREIVE